MSQVDNAHHKKEKKKDPKLWNLPIWGYTFSKSVWNVPIKSSSELGAFINQLFLKFLDDYEASYYVEIISSVERIGGSCMVEAKATQ